MVDKAIPIPPITGIASLNAELLSAAPHSPDTIQIGTTVGTHCGPGTVLVTFFRKAIG